MVTEAYRSGGQYGLIFMDCSMPIMNGFESTHKIRKFLSECNAASQPMIIALTGHIEQEYVDHAFEVKMDEVVEKPTNVEAVREILS